MKFDPHILKYIVIGGMLVLRILSRVLRKKKPSASSKPTLPANSTPPANNQRNDSPWSKTDGPFQ